MNSLFPTDTIITVFIAEITYVLEVHDHSPAQDWRSKAKIVFLPPEVGYRIHFLTNFRRFFWPFFSKIVVNPIPWRKLKWWHFRQKKWIQFLINFCIVVHHFFSKIRVNPIPWRKSKWWHFRQKKWIHFLTHFRGFVHNFFDNPSESHPLAKIEVTAFSPKKSKI